MLTILVLHSSTTSALFSWRSLGALFSLTFRDCLLGGKPQVAKSACRPGYHRLHASFVLAMAVVLACVIMAPTLTGMAMP
jgi:hypothetical protein